MNAFVGHGSPVALRIFRAADQHRLCFCLWTTNDRHGIICRLWGVVGFAAQLAKPNNWVCSFLASKSMRGFMLEPYINKGQTPRKEYEMFLILSRKMDNFVVF